MNDSKKPIIKIEDLTFTYPGFSKPALENISLTFYENQYICVVGHNGSGKSTLSKLLTGLLFPEKGSISIKGVDLNRGNKNEATLPIGIIFQNPDNQFIGSSVRDDIAFGLENRKVKNEDMEEIINSSANLCGISDLLDRAPHQLSGGQKQRVAIAGVIALNAEVILFDEATSMLDSVGKQEIKKQMIDLKKDYNKTVISITHDMCQILDADYVVALKDGEVLLEGSPDHILANMDILKQTKLENPFIIKLATFLREKGISVPNFANEKDLIQYIRRNVIV